MRDLYDRTEACRARYWDIPKDVRIEKGLRFGLGDKNLYFGARVIDFCGELLSRVFRGLYPINIDRFQRLIFMEVPEHLQNHEEVVALLESLISQLEAKLAAV